MKKNALSNQIWPADAHNLEYEGQIWQTQEYVLTAPVQGPLAERIGEERDAFSRNYRHPRLATDAQIWLIHFWQWETQEKKLIAYFSMLAAPQPPLLLEIDGFGFMPSHSIILKIRNASAVAALVKSFRPMQRMLKSLASKPHFITEPYLLFASRLKPWQYEKSVPEYQQKSFAGRCVVQELTLWKKDDHQKAFQQIARFPLQKASSPEGAAGGQIQYSLFD
ncbi:2'-5' RNA ligase family protein [Thermoflavifilum thermophilum]|uniref:Uncharacterized protein n=1 Tax=Thermoflavifilum thermophilum TaxID=1393122 RepID=A0A1I7N5E3_9BACT|nr:hypothetical protein [Thermoflavifilum thermophilum]SFV29894.1 hypothetical protein SAMN05660895_0653 [Thermoflavifilum thermophilum]